MNLSARDRRALTYLGVALILAAAYAFWPQGDAVATVSASAETVSAAEQRLQRLRRLGATVPQKEDILKKVSAETAARETGLIRTQTGAQAQAQLFTILQRLGGEEAPPIEVRQTELGAITPLGDAYGSATLSVQFECSIAQLVNYLAAIAAQQELITTRDIQITAGNQKQKTVRVRLTVAGVVPKELVPARKGA